MTVRPSSGLAGLREADAGDATDAVLNHHLAGGGLSLQLPHSGAPVGARRQRFPNRL
jgi:hypothetical protein